MSNSNFLWFILIAIFVIATIFCAWYKFSAWQKRLKKETDEVEEAVDAAFSKLRMKIEKEIEFLDKEPGLSKEEKEIRDKLQEALESSEKTIKKEIEDVKKAVD